MLIHIKLPVLGLLFAVTIMNAIQCQTYLEVHSATEDFCNLCSAFCSHYPKLPVISSRYVFPHVSALWIHCSLCLVFPTPLLPTSPISPDPRFAVSLQDSAQALASPKSPSASTPAQVMYLSFRIPQQSVLSSIRTFIHSFTHSFI